MIPSQYSGMMALTAALLLAAGIGCGGDDSAGSGGTGSGTGSGAGTGVGGNLFPTTGPGGAQSGGAGGGGCNPALLGIVRDFRAYDNGAGHPDFETFSGDGLQGIVENELGTDHKPVYAHNGGTEHTTGPEAYDQWYRDTDGVNIPVEFTITPTVDENGIATYDNDAFFPIDGQGFGDEGNPHNYHFTFELHMTFVYKGGEIFTFTGDDDLWVFANNRLAIDLGGLHEAQSDTLDLDDRAGELGIEIGEEYALDLFHAERHTVASNFRIQSSLEFTNCNPIVY